MRSAVGWILDEVLGVASVMLFGAKVLMGKDVFSNIVIMVILRGVLQQEMQGIGRASLQRVTHKYSALARKQRADFTG